MSFPPKLKKPAQLTVKKSLNNSIDLKTKTSNNSTRTTTTTSLPPRSKTPIPTTTTKSVPPPPPIPILTTSKTTTTTTRESFNLQIYTYLLTTLSHQNTLSSNLYLSTHHKLEEGIKTLEEKVGEIRIRNKIMEEFQLMDELEEEEGKRISSGGGGGRERTVKILEGGMKKVRDSQELRNGDADKERIYAIQLELDEIDCALSRIQLEGFPAIEALRRNLRELIKVESESLSLVRS